MIRTFFILEPPLCLKRGKCRLLLAFLLASPLTLCDFFLSKKDADREVLISAAGSGTVVDCGAASDNGGWAQLHVLSNAASGNATFTVAHATSSGGSYATLGTFNVVTAGGTTAQKLVIPAGTTINRYVKLVVAGTLGGNISVHMNLVRTHAAAV
jgi:hypothetical protein